MVVVGQSMMCNLMCLLLHARTAAARRHLQQTLNAAALTFDDWLVLGAQPRDNEPSLGFEWLGLKVAVCARDLEP